MPSKRCFGDPRSERIVIRVKPAEKDHLAAIAVRRDCTVSDLARRAVLNLTLPEAPPNRVDRDAVAALNRLGANLWRAMQAADDLRPHIQPLIEEIAALKRLLMGSTDAPR